MNSPELLVRRLKKPEIPEGSLDEKYIPEGPYCYRGEYLCPYWSKDHSKPDQENGYCSFIKKGDWELNFGLLWDQCKECGINWGDDDII